MESLRLEHVYWVVGGLVVFLVFMYAAFWLSINWPEIVKFFGALKARFIIDYDKLADLPEKRSADTRRALPNAYQHEPDFPRTGSLGAEPSNASLTEYLAGLKRLDNPEVWRFSANRIADLVGGTRADVMTLIREVRAEEEPEPENPLRVRDSSGERFISRV